jgi:signal transduction histidine kinase
MEVSAEIVGENVAIEISDNGVGPPPQNNLGRGLTGMRERVRALDGTFELRRHLGRTLVRCRLPLEYSAKP